MLNFKTLQKNVARDESGLPTAVANISILPFFYLTGDFLHKCWGIGKLSSEQNRPRSTEYVNE